MLLVDADRNFGRALAIALQLDGIPADTAGSAEEALASLGHRRYRTFLVDCLLPGADELFLQLGELGGVHVIATGAHPELLAVARRRHPWLGTLQKPFPAAELAAQLGEERAVP